MHILPNISMHILPNISMHILPNISMHILPNISMHILPTQFSKIPTYTDKENLFNQSRVSYVGDRFYYLISCDMIKE